MYSLIGKRLVADSAMALKVSRVMAVANFRLASNTIKDKEKGDEKVYFSKSEGIHLFCNY